jgi:hypothetical protein
MREWISGMNELEWLTSANGLLLVIIGYVLFDIRDELRQIKARLDSR